MNEDEKIIYRNFLTESRYMLHSVFLLFPIAILGFIKHSINCITRYGYVNKYELLWLIPMLLNQIYLLSLLKKMKTLFRKKLSVNPEFELEKEKNNNFKHKKFFIFSLTMVIISILPSIIPFSLAYKCNHLFRKIEFPLGIVSDAFLINDRIIINSLGSLRIQVYDLDGKFCYGFPRSSHSTVQLGNGFLHISSLKRYYKFDLEGNLFQIKKINNIERCDLIKKFPEKINPQIKVVGKLLTSYVIYKNDIGKTIKIGTKWYLWLFNVPFPAMIYSLIMYHTRPRKIVILQPIENIYFKIMKKLFANRSQI